MKTILKITRNELANLFYSPIAWLILIIFAFQAGMAFSDAFAGALRSQALGYNPSTLTRTLLLGWDGAISSVQEHLYLYIPLLTMGLMSLEYSRGSIKLLYTSPVTNRQIVFGKYLSMMVYGLLLTGLLFLCFIFCLFTVKDLDVPYALSGLLGIYLLICAYAAIGLFMSSLTAYQVVAAVSTLATLATLNYIGKIGQDIPFIRDITWWLSISGRSETLLAGLITSEDILYFLLVIALFLGLTLLKLQSERSKKSRGNMIARFSCIILLTLGIGYLSSRPALMAYYDATEKKNNTLTQNSLEVMAKMEGPLSITTYVNFLDENYFRALPQKYNEDLQRFEKYIRFKPEIKMKYVYYYDETYNPHLRQRYPNMTDEEIIQRICEVIDWNPDKLLKPEAIRQLIDLSEEDNRFVRVLERGNGQRSFLRLYEDNSRYPSESEITAALKRLVVKPPLVGFLTGHGERDIFGSGERDYTAFAQNRTFRYSLLNQGFDVTTVTPENYTTTLAEIDILVIADIREPLSPSALQAIEDYIRGGGNLIIAGEPRRQETMNPVLHLLGLEFMPGTLVQQSRDFTPDLILGNITPQAAALSSEFRYINRSGGKITMPGAVGIRVIDEGGFQKTPLIATDSVGSWSELETTDFIEDQVALNPEAGEIEQSQPTAMYLSRTLNNGKEQRIIVSGDADCISNGELSKDRNGIAAYNFSMITESFRLLTYGEFPVSTDRERSSDNQLYITDKAGIWIKIGFMGIIPGGLLILAITCLYRRKKK